MHQEQGCAFHVLPARARKSSRSYAAEIYLQGSVLLVLPNDGIATAVSCSVSGSLCTPHPQQPDFCPDNNTRFVGHGVLTSFRHPASGAYFVTLYRTDLQRAPLPLPTVAVNDTLRIPLLSRSFVSVDLKLASSFKASIPRCRKLAKRHGVSFLARCPCRDRWCSCSSTGV